MHDLKRRLQRGSARHRSGVNAERMSDLDAGELSETECDEKSCGNSDERQKIVFSARRSRHALEELPSVENADPIQKHDQSGETDRTGDLRLRRKGANRQADKQHGADTERKSPDIDLTDQIADADGKEDGKNGLGADDITGKSQHGCLSRRCARGRRSARLTAG